MTADKDLWDGLQPSASADRLNGRRPNGMPDTVDVRVALDHRALRHLLIRVPDGTENLPRPRTRGLEIVVEPLENSDGQIAEHLNLACTETAAGELFAGVVAEILEELRATPIEPRAAVAKVLQRWSWFWSVPPQGLGSEEVMGLFAELWFLEQWIGPVSSQTLRHWTGPWQDRHDFKWPAASIEVKGTRAPAQGAPRHHISSLDQLDDSEQGDLHLFSLRVTPDPIGHHHLPGIIERIAEHLEGDLEATGLWNERLAKARYSPQHADRYREPLRIVAQELFRVEAGFPRIIRSTFPLGIPAGVDDIGYTINLAACADFRIATGPHDPAIKDIRQTLP